MRERVQIYDYLVSIIAARSMKLLQRISVRVKLPMQRSSRVDDTSGALTPVAQTMTFDSARPASYRFRGGYMRSRADDDAEPALLTVVFSGVILVAVLGGICGCGVATGGFSGFLPWRFYHGALQRISRVFGRGRRRGQEVLS